MSSVQPESSAKDKNGGKTALASTSDDGDFFSSGAQGLEPKYMRQDSIRSRCALAYIDQLFISTSVHRHKTVEFIGERLAVLCSRYPALAERSARLLLVTLGFYPPLDKKKKDLLDSQTAWKLFNILVRFALSPAHQGSLLLVGSRHIVEHFLYLLTPDLKVREIRGSATLDKFLEQIKTVVSNYESCVLLQRLVRWYDVEEELNKHFVPFFTQFPLETNKYSFDSLLEVLSKDLKFKSNTFDLDCLEHSVVVSKIHSGRSIPSQEDTPFLLSVTICYLARKARCPVKLTVECMAGQANKMIENKLLDPGPIRDGMIAADEDAFTQLLRNKGAEVTEDDGELLELLGTLPMSIHYNYGCAQAIKYMMSNPEGKPVHEMRSAPFNSNVNVSEDPEPGWNGRNFVRASDAEWRILLPEFDCPDLHVNRQSLKVFASVMNAAFPNNTFPVHTLYAPHKYPGTHFNMLNTIIENPDVMCLRAYDHTPVVEPSYGLKTPIDDTDPAIGNWQCLELTCSLLMLAVQSPYHKLEIKRIFLEAAHLCLDVVVLALFRAPVPMTEMRLGLLTDLLSKLILQNTNAAPILNHAWNMTDVPYAKQFKELILFSLASIYTIDDQTKLTKILDIAHELKPSGLSDLLVEEKNLNLVVDLACLASKRSYLNIEKWLEDNFKLHGDSLITTVLSHIQRRYKRPALVTAWENRSTKTTVDPIGILLNFVNQKANEKQRTEFKDIFQVFEVMKESGRSSSVSSTGGRNPIQIQNPSGFAQGPLRQDNRTMNPMANFVPNNPHPPINFPGLVQQPHMMGQPPQPPLPMGNMNSFAQANRDILKNFQPAPPMPTSTSPSNQMLRSQVSMNQRQSGSNSGYHSGGTTRSSGPSTPSSHGQMEYRPIQPNIHGFTPLFQPNQDYPARLQILQPAGPEPSQPFPGDVQSDANTFFEKLYNTENPMPTSELINLMKQLKSSTKERDQLILDCVIENLFEEYRFFHDYPERELRVTAEVYGGIIREGIIEKVKFATGMRKVVEALSSETNSKLFQFGSIVMQNCKTKLNQYPKMCSMIMKMENFKALPQSVRDYVLAGETGSLPAEATVRSSTPVWQVRTNDSKSSAQPKSILSYTNIDTLVQMTEKDGAKIEQPSEAVVDKVAFLFNNLSNTNLEVKKDELLALMKEHGEEFLKWLAQYVVMKRVSLENNFHPMYNMFLICLKSPELDDLVKKETFRNIKILLRTDKRDPSANYSDRTLLKNLGTWLGYITIARNNPIILKEIDLRSLLLEAYYKGQSELLYAVPFISKILHSCSKSKLFPPTCAWIRSILKVLAELHAEPDLKINLRFEIEVLCKELQVDLTSLPCDGVLKDTEKLVRVPQQLTPLRQIARPEVSSPIPQQLRLEVSSQSPVTDTKPSTPQPGSESAEGGSSSGAGQGSATSHSTDATVPVNTTHFAYHDINVHTFEGFYPHVAVAQALPIFQLHPYTKQLVRPALAQAIKELIGPVAERALRIAMTVTENMVKKDFSLDPDENNMKTSAFHMMRAMTAAMAMITCREPLATNIHGYLIQAFQNTLLRNNTMSPEMQKMIDQAATIITQENVELATNFIVKTACEKAAPELDKRLENEYQRRISARRDGTVFKDEAVQAIQTRLPNAIAITPGPTDKAVMNVYEQFSSRICGFKPATEEQMTEVPRVVHEPVPIQQKEISAEQFIAQTQMFIQEIDMKVNSHSQPNSKAFQAVRVIREHLTNCIAAPRDQNVMGTLVNTAVDQLLFAYVHDQGQPTPTTEWNRRLLDLFVSIMRLMRYHYSNTELARRVTIGLINIRSDYKWNIDGIEALLKQNLVQKILWDEHLAAAMEGGTNLEASVFAQKYLRALTGGDVTKTSTFRDLFPKTYEQLIKLQQLQAKHNQQHEPGHASHSGGTIGGTDTMSSLSELAGVPRKPDDAELTGKVEMILREWIGICYTPLVTRNPQEAFVTMLGLIRHTLQMNEHSVLATDDKIADFFRVCIEMCVDVSVRMLKSDGTNQPAHQQTVVRQRCFYTLDAFVKLMALMVRHSDSNQVLNKINLLKRLLKVFIGVLHVDHDVRKGEFNAMPYHRIIISLFNEITTPDAENTLEPVAWSILEGFGQTLFALQPRRLPGFAFAWLDIVGHRHVIGRLLANTGIAATVEPVKTTAMFTQLIISHLKFLAPFLRNIQLPKAISILYKGTLRVLLVILHDFPELLCEYHYAICDTIPPNCVQLRNLVLSAYPRNMRLPDPFALNFKFQQVDSIPDMSIEPKSNLSMSAIIPEATRVQLDEYLSTRTPVTFLTNLPSLLQLSSVPGQKYNTTVMNAIVLYVGMRAIENLRENRQRISIHTIAHTSYMDIFQNLAVQLCTEGRYLLFNGIANQLRYPNAHTHYFSCVFLFLFLTSDCDAIQEQITRILFERLVALRPHPWGLLITFIELIKNPTYSFWKYEFTRCAPEIERLFQNVANTCTPASSQTASGAGGLAGQPHLLGGASNLIGGTAPLTEQQIQQMQQQMQATVTTGANTTPTTPVQQR